MHPELPDEFPSTAILHVIDSIRKGNLKSREFAHALWVLGGFAIGKIVSESRQPYFETDRGGHHHGHHHHKEHRENDVDVSTVTPEDFASILESANVKGQGKEFGPISWILIAKMCVKLLSRFI